MDLYSPAFPRPISSDPNGNIDHGDWGVTKREYFAAAALTGLLSRGEAFENAVKGAYDIADAMIAKHSKDCKDEYDQRIAKKNR